MGHASTTVTSPMRSTRRPVLIVVAVVGIASQLFLVALGCIFVFGAEDVDSVIAQLITWCLLASLYWIGAVISLRIGIRRRRVAAPDDPTATPLSLRLASAIVTVAATLLTSLVGLGAATDMLALRGDEYAKGAIEFLAVWAMVLSWGLFHWGYARIYHYLYYAAKGPAPLEFPGTPRPLLTDFVYFAFTNGTSFAVSDVLVTSSRMRWTVVWHTTFSFFLNALIIVLAINTITSGVLFST